MIEAKKCPVCKQKIADYESRDHENLYIYECKRCGKVQMYQMLEMDLGAGKFSDILTIASGLLRERTWRGEDTLLLALDNFEKLVRNHPFPKTISSKAWKILEFMEHVSSSYGWRIFFDYSDAYVLTYSKDDEEFRYVLAYLENLGLIKSDITEAYVITPTGWDRLSEYSKSRRDSDQVFIAMSFDDKLDDAYVNGIKNAVKECGYNPIRMKELEHNGTIDDRILVEIARSRFLIADVTFHRQGVYFEAGYALGMKIPVIWSCRKDNFNDCHFDTRQYNHIVWESIEELYQRLFYRIKITMFTQS